MGMHLDFESGIHPCFAGWQRRKQGLLGIGVVLTVLLAVLAIVRVVPVLDDAISGPPQSMRAIATLTAEQMGAAVGSQYAVFVMQDEGQTCLSTLGDPEYYELKVMVLTYSESRHSLCAMTEAPPVNPRLTTMVLHTAEFHNYGRPLKGNIPLISLSYKQIIYPADYLALMNWRTVVKPGVFRHVGRLRSKTDADPADTKDSVDINLPVSVVRARVAEHHNAVNAPMDRGLMLLGAAWLAIAWLLWAMFRQVRQEAPAYSQPAPDPLAFARCDLAILARTWTAQRLDAERQQHEQERAEAH